MITNEQLAEWEALAEKATAGPWPDPVGCRRCDSLHLNGFQNEPHPCMDAIVAVERDMDFIASARTAVPALIAEVRRLRDIVSDMGGARSQPGGCSCEPTWLLQMGGHEMDCEKATQAVAKSEPRE